MLNRLKNLWAWSQIDPYVLGAETGKALADAIVEGRRMQPGSIEYPNTTVEEFKAQPSEAATLEEIEAAISQLPDNK